MIPRRGRAALLGAAGLAAVSIYFLAAFGHPFGGSNDESVYVLLAKALRRGEFSFPGAFAFPVTDPLPGYPLLLLLPAWLLEPHWNLFWTLGLIPSLAVPYLAWRLARRTLEPGQAWLAAALTAANPQLVEYAGTVIPDTSYLALSLILFEALSRAESDAAIGLWALGGALAALMRPHGALLVLALAALVGARRGWRRGILFAALALLPLGLWTLRNRLIAGTVSGYAVNWRSQLSFLDKPGGQPAHFLDIAAVLFGEGLLGLRGLPWAAQSAGGMAALGLIGYGTRRLMRGRDQPLVFAVAVYGAMVLALHATWETLIGRYAITLVPFAWMLALSAGEAFARKAKAAKPAAVALCLALPLWQDIQAASRGFRRQGVWADKTMAWIRTSTLPSDRFEGVVCPEIRLVGERDADCGDPHGNRDAWIAALLERKIGFVYVCDVIPDGFNPEPMWRTIVWRLDWARSSPFFKERYRNADDHAAIFELRHPDPARFRKAWRAAAAGVAAGRRGGDKRFIRRKLQEAVSLEPNLAVAWHALALLETQPEARLRYLRKAALADPSSEAVQDALRQPARRSLP